MKKLKSLGLCFVIIAVLTFAFQPTSVLADSGGPQGTSNSPPSHPPPPPIPWWMLLGLLW